MEEAQPGSSSSSSSLLQCRGRVTDAPPLYFLYNSDRKLKVSPSFSPSVYFSPLSPFFSSNSDSFVRTLNLALANTLSPETEANCKLQKKKIVVFIHFLFIYFPFGSSSVARAARRSSRSRRHMKEELRIRKHN